MNAIFLIAFRNLVFRTSRTFLTTAGIAIGIAAAVAVFTLDHNTLITLISNELQRYGAPDLEIIPAAQTPEAFSAAVSALRARPFFKDVTPVFFANGFAVSPEGPVGLEVIGTEPAASGWYGGYYLRENSADIPGDAQPVVLLTDTAARRLRVSAGDSLRFAEHPDRPLYVAGLISTWKLGSRNSGLVAIVPFGLGWQVFRGQGVQPRLWVKTDGALNAEQVGAILGPDYQVLVPDYLRAGQTGDKRIMRQGVRISGLMTLLLGQFLVFTALSMALAERIREIGLMRAIGATDRQITAAMIVEAGIMAIAGAVVGVIAGIALAWALMQFGFSSLGAGTRVWFFALPRTRIAGLAGLGMLTALAGAGYPLLKSRGISTVEALKQRGLNMEILISRKLYAAGIGMGAILIPAGFAAVGAATGFAWRPLFPLALCSAALLSAIFAIIFLGPSLMNRLIRVAAWPFKRMYHFEGLQAERAVSRATDRISASLLTLALVLGGVIALKHMTLSLKQESRGWADAALHQVVFVRTPMLSPEAYGAFAHVPGVRRAIPMSYTVQAPFLIRGIPGWHFDHGPLFDSEARRRAFTDTPSLIVSSQLAQIRGLAEGDSVTLSTRHGPEKLPVFAISDAYGYYLGERAYAVMPLEHLKEMFDAPTAANQFTLTLEDRADPETVRLELLGWFGQYPMEIITGDQKRAWVVDGVDDDFFIFEIVLAITGLLAGIGVTNTLLIGALERRREFGLIQALGVTPAQMSRMIVLEGTVIGVVGGLLAALLGAPLSWIIVETLRLVSELPLEFVVSPAFIGWAVAASTAISTVSGLYPAWRTGRIPITESLRYE